MVRYGNGNYTRDIIIKACRKLFYEKGYSDTTYDDICREAHVNRGSIYYHFKLKENIQQIIAYEVFNKCCEEAFAYCNIAEYNFVLGTAIYWYKFKEDPCFRNIFVDAFSLVSKFDATQKNWSANTLVCFGDIEFYGEMTRTDILRELVLDGIGGRMAAYVDQNPDSFTFEELTKYELTATAKLHDIPSEVIEETWRDIARYIRKIPFETLDTTFDGHEKKPLLK